MGDKWITETSAININAVKTLIYKTDLISDYLKYDSSTLCISANKGMGKTLILGEKRRNLVNTQPSGMFIPKDGYLDMSLGLPVLYNDGIALLSNYDSAKKLWSFALLISIISYHGFESIDFTGYSLSKDLREWLRGASKQHPSDAFLDLINDTRSLSLINKLHEYEKPLRRAISSINRPVYVFIDKVDQAAASLPKDAWVGIQIGLLSASIEINQSNPHIKVFSTIRQEAWASFRSPLKANMDTYVGVVRYSNQDLKSIMDKLSEFYENCPTLERCLKVNDINNENSFHTEEIFPYMLRHTIGRPRDLVFLMKELSVQNAFGDKDLIKSLINEVSEGQIVQLVRDENIMLHSSLSNVSEVDYFLSLIPRNILNREEILSIFRLYNNLDHSDESHYSSSKFKHPFSDLYAMGLLGCSSKVPGRNLNQQRFKRPSDLNLRGDSRLPISDYYFIHPCLNRTIDELSLESYYVFRGIVIGQEHKWSSYEIETYASQLQLQNTGKSEAISMVNDFLNNLSDEGVTRFSSTIEMYKNLGSKSFFEELQNYSAETRTLIELLVEHILVETHSASDHKIRNSQPLHYPNFDGSIDSCLYTEYATPDKPILSIFEATSLNGPRIQLTKENIQTIVENQLFPNTEYAQPIKKKLGIDISIHSFVDMVIKNNSILRSNGASAWTTSLLKEILLSLKEIDHSRSLERNHVFIEYWPKGILPEDIGERISEVIIDTKTGSPRWISRTWAEIESKTGYKGLPY